MSLVTNITNAFTRVATEFKSVRSTIGTLSNLTTTTKTDTVSAINEVNAKTASAGAQINDTTPSTTTTYSGSKTESLVSGSSTNDRARANHTGTQTASTISDFSSAADARITAQKGANSGLASLDSGGKVPSSQLPAYVDDVLEYANLSSLPATGVSGVIYVTLDTNYEYRWGGSSYIRLVASPGSTDAVPEGTTNLYFTTARAAAAAPVQTVAGRSGTVTLTKSDVGLANVDNTADTAKPVSTAQAAADNLRLLATNNLSDVPTPATARTNLGVYGTTDIGDVTTDFSSQFVAALA
jgi:hypothetical protein